MKASIHLASDQSYADLTIIEDDLSVQKKRIPIQSLWDIFHTRESYTYFCPCTFFNSYETNAKLPGLLYGISKTDSSKGLFFLPAAQRYMNFAGEQTTLPYPSLIFYLEEFKGILNIGKCFALKVHSLSKLNMKSILYVFPFGNVSPSSAEICWGNNVTTGLNGFEGLSHAIKIFLCSESNMDYIQKSNFKGYNSYTNFLQHLKNQDDFPNAALVPSSCFHTVGELLQKLF